MNALVQNAARWEPMADIPETPCADFKLKSSESGTLELTLRYSWIAGNKMDLALNFSDVRAIRTHWDGDGDGPLAPEPPRCTGAHSMFIWPLLLVAPSRWLASDNFAASISIAEALAEEPWQHYRVLTLERSLDVLARGAIDGAWASPSA